MWDQYIKCIIEWMHFMGAYDESKAKSPKYSLNDPLNLFPDR